MGLPIDAAGVVSEVTGHEKLVAAISDQHPMARRHRIGLRDLSKEAYTLWPRHLSPGSYDQLLTIFQRAGFGPPITMEGGLPSTETVLGMVAAGLTIALVDPAIQQRATPGVVFRPIEDHGVFTESGVIYRQGDTSPLLASLLQEIRLTPRRRPNTEAADPKTPSPSRRRAVKPRARRTGRSAKKKRREMPPGADASRWV